MGKKTDGCFWWGVLPLLPPSSFPSYLPLFLPLSLHVSFGATPISNIINNILLSCSHTLPKSTSTWMFSQILVYFKCFLSIKCLKFPIWIWWKMYNERLNCSGCAPHFGLIVSKCNEDFSFELLFKQICFWFFNTGNIIQFVQFDQKVTFPHKSDD